jgi:hypothetical protein
MRLKAELDKVKAHLHADIQLLAWEVDDAQLFREEIESKVRVARIREEIQWDGDIKVASDTVLLAILGYTDDAAGRLKFRDEGRVFFSLLRHARRRPHVCGEFCGGSPIVPADHNEAERSYFLADVHWHLGYFERQGYESPIHTLHYYAKRWQNESLPSAVLLAAVWLGVLKPEEIVEVPQEPQGVLGSQVRPPGATSHPAPAVRRDGVTPRTANSIDKFMEEIDE